MLTAPAVVITYTRHRCSARVAMSAMDDAAAADYRTLATEAARQCAGTEWRLIDAVAAQLDKDTTLRDPAEALRRAGMAVPEGM